MNTAAATHSPTQLPMRRANIAVRGIAKRCRKPDTHIVDLGFHDIGTKPENLETSARALLSTFKSVTSATLHLNYVEVDPDNHKNFTMVIFDSRHLVMKLA
jgi:hypothetical protein